VFEKFNNFFTHTVEAKLHFGVIRLRNKTYQILDVNSVQYIERKIIVNHIISAQKTPSNYLDTPMLPFFGKKENLDDPANPILLIPVNPR
jgi:hypothetical protein